jgi:F0F1-type ATP synthase assembly protein I
LIPSLVSGEPSDAPPPKRSESSVPPSARNSLWAHAYGGTQLAVSVLLGLFLGYWLDRKWGFTPWFTLAGSALGLAVGLYGFLKPFFLKKR